MKEILAIIEKETNGQCFASQKYSIDLECNPALSYDHEKEISVEVEGETEKQDNYIDLSEKAKKCSKEGSIFKYFLDGSRHVYNVAYVNYNEKIYPIISGQIGVGCCERINRKIKIIDFIEKM